MARFHEVSNRLNESCNNKIRTCIFLDSPCWILFYLYYSYLTDLYRSNGSAWQSGEPNRTRNLCISIGSSHVKNLRLKITTPENPNTCQNEGESNTHEETWEKIGLRPTQLIASLPPTLGSSSVASHAAPYRQEQRNLPPWCVLTSIHQTSKNSTVRNNSSLKVPQKSQNDSAPDDFNADLPQVVPPSYRNGMCIQVGCRIH